MAIRLGTEDKKKRLWAIILVSLALTLIAHTVWTLVSGPPSAVPPSAASPSTAAIRTASTPMRDAGAAGPAAQHMESASALDPTLHPERMAMAENTTYTGTSRNIFSRDSLPPAIAANGIEKPLASVRTGGVIAPAGPAPPPPIDLKFYGYATEQNGRKMIFLLQGEDVFIAGQGDIVDGRYKVVQISASSVTIEDLAYNDTQTLPLLAS